MLTTDVALWMAALALSLNVIWQIVATIVWGPHVRVRTAHRYVEAAKGAGSPAQTPRTEPLMSGPLPQRKPRIEDTLSGRELFATDVEKAAQI